MTARAERQLREDEARVAFADVGGCVYRTAERLGVPVHEAADLLGLTFGSARPFNLGGAMSIKVQFPSSDMELPAHVREAIDDALQAQEALVGAASFYVAAHLAAKGAINSADAGQFERMTEHEDRTREQLYALVDATRAAEEKAAVVFESNRNLAARGITNGAAS